MHRRTHGLASRNQYAPHFFKVGGIIKQIRYSINIRLSTTSQKLNVARILKLQKRETFYYACKIKERAGSDCVKPEDQ